ncbi:hypothetical protein QUC31_000371 [Theobroma cacao]|uniref:Pentatricopeptide repeat (PPR) superfamily protein n=1 Tax=Theobroma cacao TaxID=3641 RepID=A0A061FDX3_THECC|nr:Pentatricopeptide repeat (PPR) superfamily protein [Theobroma cacao]
MTVQALPFFEILNRSILPCLNSAVASLSQTSQAHAYILKSGVCIDTLISTKLISQYANRHCFAEAELVLNSISEPLVSSFSALIYALNKYNLFTQSLYVFSRMLSRGILPDNRVLPNVVKACGKLSAFKLGKEVHGIVVKYGFDSDSVVQASLVHLYLKGDRIQDAKNVFERLPERDVVTCGALLSAYARKGCVNEAKEIFYGMQSFGVGPNLVSWNGMITGFNQSEQYNEAVVMFKEMHSEGFLPDDITISSVFSAVGDLERLNIGIQVLCYVIKLGLLHCKFVISALMDMFGKCACAGELMKAFEEVDEEIMDTGALNALITGLSRNGLVDVALETFQRFRVQGRELNVVSWTSIIAGCSQNGKDIEALELFREMQSARLKPNSVTIPCLLPACGNIAALIHGKAAHGFAIRTGIANDVHVGSALVDMYAKCGRIHLSRLCFDRIPSKNSVCWNAIMGGYAMHGKAKEAIDIFHMMQRRGQKPDFISFSCVLSACSQGGLTEEGWHFFNSMSRDHGVKAKMEHYSCMVNLLGRSGKLEQAYALIQQMPFEPDACVWGALLSSCRLHNNISLGEIAAQNLFKLEPSNPGNYILLSNIYASKGMWDEVDAVRDVMRSRGMKKNPGCSWIEIKNQVHMLLAGDKSHPQMTEIIEKIYKLSMDMKKAGYLPNTDFVLQDVDEQDKEQILCGHSEKLAVAFGLLNTPPGSPLQIIKNLRICGDCHAVIKFISGFEGREIYVRDTNRFHHFKDGVCSCRDYW